MILRHLMQIVPSTPINPVLTRVIGTTDFRGAGTSHQLTDVNPFVLLDEAATITQPNTPPFGLHPHSGAMILTICLSGEIENCHIGKNGNEVKEVHGPGPLLLAVNAGRGVVHDEHTFSADPTKLFQLAWMTGDDESEAEVLQVNNPIIIHEDNGTDIMLCAGSFRGKESGMMCKQIPSVTVLHVTLPPGGAFVEDFGQGGTFAYNLKCNDESGMLKMNEADVPVASVLVLRQNGELKITNEGSCSMSVLIGYGEPLIPSWTKMLMGNGFIFAKSEDCAKKKEEEFLQVGVTEFGQLSQNDK